ncbi:hypothetical protein [Undibacterium sp.]|jgi:hypothetical protein|uniref:hypothetical protein n=1 Tax=Undibacterium sp. TaxID=1914977 RepID=UPI002BF48CA6|nr:hypothetical protein [Undibacterium sp.]HTD02447.1 hypothetical protein [Undibacterium sp.]
MPDLTKFEDEYTRKVSGETFQYTAEFTSGENVAWSARIYQGGVLKGEPGGTFIDNTAVGNDLRMYVISYIETIIEKGLGIDE